MFRVIVPQHDCVEVCGNFKYVHKFVAYIEILTIELFLCSLLNVNCSSFGELKWPPTEI